VRRRVDPPLDRAAYDFRHAVRVRFAETDAMGIAHHAAYLPYLEEARVAYLRAIGHPYRDVRHEGVEFAVLEVAVRYLQPLLFDDEVDVHLVLASATRATFQLAYLLTVEDRTCAAAITVHGCVDQRGRPVRMPGWLRTLVPAPVT
jgi:acyl-CoA thioester hydrolase